MGVDRTRGRARTAYDILSAELKPLRRGWAHASPSAQQIFFNEITGQLWASPGPRRSIRARAAVKPPDELVGRFLAACTKTAPNARVQSSALHKSFLTWAHANSEPEWTVTRFGRELRARGLKSFRSNVVWWLGIELTKTATVIAQRKGEAVV